LLRTHPRQLCNSSHSQFRFGLRQNSEDSSLGTWDEGLDRVHIVHTGDTTNKSDMRLLYSFIPVGSPRLISLVNRRG
jgi:hypothetical protein